MSYRRMPILSSRNLPPVRGEYIENFPSRKLSWFRVGGVIDVLYRPQDVDDLAFFLRNIDRGVKWYVIGAGSNTFVRDGGFRGVIIKLTDNEVSCQDHTICADASVLDHTVAKAALVNGVGGMEFLSGIPGSIGGAIAMNAGCYGREFKNIFIRGRFMDAKGDIIYLMNSDMNFSYRTSPRMRDLILLSAEMCGYPSNSIKENMERVQSSRRDAQPIGQKTCGSTFKNLPDKSAWQLISDAGCVGLRVGGASVSEKHCNFIINDENATASDIEDLILLIEDKVMKHCGIALEREIKIMGDVNQ